ncbi:hypothetical protein QQ045_004040 [Rhodiola kirilowii]
MVFKSSGQQAGQGDGVSELDEAAELSSSKNFEFVFDGNNNQNIAARKRDVHGYKSGSTTPTANGSLKEVGSLLSNLQLEEDTGCVLRRGNNGFMSENGIQALPANSHNSEGKPLAHMTVDEYQMVAQRFQGGVYDGECQSLFSNPPGHPFHQSVNNSRELEDSQRARLRPPVSVMLDQTGYDLARISSGGHGASADLLQHDHGLQSNSSVSSSLFHHASQKNSDQLVTGPETNYFRTSAFSGLEHAVGLSSVASRAGMCQRETHGTMPIPYAPCEHDYLWKSKIPEVPPIRRCSSPNLLMDGSQLFCNASSGTTNTSDIRFPVSDISMVNTDHHIQSHINIGTDYQQLINQNQSEKQLGSIQNFNFQKINYGYESDSTISGVNRLAAPPNGVFCFSDPCSGRKSSGFPPVEAPNSFLDSEIQSVGFPGPAGSMDDKHLHPGEALGHDIERIKIQQRSQFRLPEMVMAYLQKNSTAAGINVHPLESDFGITSRNFMELQKAYYEKAFLAQQIQQRESYINNFDNKCQLNPSYGLGLHYRENSMRNSMTHSVNGSRNHMLHNRRVSHSRNGMWHSDFPAKSGGKLQTSFREEMKINKVHFFGLSDMVGHVAKFSMDQFGSRLIQKKLETASEEDKNLIFPEISLHARQLMIHVFGNYVIQKFLERGTPSQRRELVDQLSGFVLTLSLDMYGCRVIQKALDVVDVDQTSKIIAELSYAVIKCVHDPNGNHVIQKCIESIPEDRIQSIITTFYGHVAALSTHTYGCRVIQRVLEYCVDQKTREIVFHEILESILMLAQNQYGNYVVQRLLLHGKEHERSAIISKLASHVVNMSQQKYASNVIEMCLENCSPEDRQLLVSEILKSTGGIEPLQVLMQDQYGNYVVQRILTTCPDEDLEPILSRIKVHLKSLKKYTFSKNIVSRIEKLVVTGERRLQLSSLYK